MEEGQGGTGRAGDTAAASGQTGNGDVVEGGGNRVSTRAIHDRVVVGGSFRVLELLEDVDARARVVPEDRSRGHPLGLQSGFQLLERPEIARVQLALDLSRECPLHHDRFLGPAVGVRGDVDRAAFADRDRALDRSAAHDVKRVHGGAVVKVANVVGLKEPGG